MPGASGRRWADARWPALVVGGIQAALSLRLLGANTAFIDEGTYLNAGHAEIAHWLHGVPVPAFEQWLSGSPAIYPPIAAVADSAGGLAAARVLSLLCMLAATALLWSATSRLLGRRTALLAAAIFAITPATQFLGAFATFDALALMLLGAAAWCAVRSADCAVPARAALLAGTVALLVLANATKYSSALWDPVVVGLAGLALARRVGWASGIAVGLATGLATALALLGAWEIGGPGYQQGIDHTTLARASGGTAMSLVFTDAARWIGPVAVLAVAGAITLTCQRRLVGAATCAAGWTLTAAVFLAPAQEMRIHTVTSLFKHVDYGAWFAAGPAGYAISAVLALLPARWYSRVFGACAAGLAALAVLASVQAAGHDRSWPSSTTLVARLRPLLAGGHGPWLGENDTVLIYYTGTLAGDWRSTWGPSYRNPVTHRLIVGPRAYATAIRQHYFRVVVLSSDYTPQLDAQLKRDLAANRGYRLVARIPEGRGGHGDYLIWRYAGHRPPIPR